MLAQLQKRLEEQEVKATRKCEKSVLERDASIHVQNQLLTQVEVLRRAQTRSIDKESCTYPLRSRTANTAYAGGSRRRHRSVSTSWGMLRWERALQAHQDLSRQGSCGDGSKADSWRYNNPVAAQDRSSCEFRILLFQKKSCSMDSRSSSRYWASSNTSEQSFPSSTFDPIRSRLWSTLTTTISCTGRFPPVSRAWP